MVQCDKVSMLQSHHMTTALLLFVHGSIRVLLILSDSGNAALAHVRGPPALGEADFRKAFSNFAIQNIRVLEPRETSFAIIRFTTPELARAAIQKLNGHGTELVGSSGAGPWLRNEIIFFPRINRQARVAAGV